MTMLSNMGALDEDKAVSTKILNNSERLKNLLIDNDIKNLEDRGYVVRIDDKLYLTQSGLVRALSNFS
jgi:spore germination protein YaaH